MVHFDTNWQNVGDIQLFNHDVKEELMHIFYEWKDASDIFLSDVKEESKYILKRTGKMQAIY